MTDKQPQPKRRPKLAERFTVVIEAKPGQVPVAVRLRGWLKLGLRAFGLRCVRIEPRGTGSSREAAPQVPVPARSTMRF